MSLLSVTSDWACALATVGRATQAKNRLTSERFSIGVFLILVRSIITLPPPNDRGGAGPTQLWGRLMKEREVFEALPVETYRHNDLLPLPNEIGAFCLTPGIQNLGLA